MNAPPDLHARFAATLERTEWLPRPQLDAYRDQLLKRLVMFAFERSPFHRERLQPLFRNGGDPDLRAWRDLPIMRRGDIEADIDRINPAEVPDELGPVSTLRTSGSTGARVSFRTCALAQIAAECMIDRLYRWHGFDLAAAMASIRFYSSGHTYPDGKTDRRWSRAGPEAPHHTLDLRTPLDDLIEWLARRAPKYLLTFPSICLDLAQAPDACALDTLKVEKIVGISEIVTAHTRRLVRERLRADIAQIYACGEMGCIALQSPADDQCLVCEESVFVEIVDDAGEPVPAGEPGRVILTSLYNYATPFIRYEIGDFATLADAPCPSGRTLQRLQRIEGRARNRLVTAAGGALWAHGFPADTVARQLATEHFQVCQPDLDTIELVYVPDRHANAPDEAGVAELFARLLGKPVRLKLRPVDEIARTTGGKRELIVSQIA